MYKVFLPETFYTLFFFTSHKVYTFANILSMAATSADDELTRLFSADSTSNYISLDVEKKKILVNPFSVVPWAKIRDVSIGGDGNVALETNIRTFGIFHENAPFCVILSSDEFKEAMAELPDWHCAILTNLREHDPTGFKLYGIVDGAHRVYLVHKLIREGKSEPFCSADYKLMIRVPTDASLRWNRFEICSSAQMLNQISDAVVNSSVFDRIKSCIRTKKTVSIYLCLLH